MIWEHPCFEKPPYGMEASPLWDNELTTSHVPTEQKAGNILVSAYQLLSLIRNSQSVDGWLRKGWFTFDLLVVCLDWVAWQPAAMSMNILSGLGNTATDVEEENHLLLWYSMWLVIIAWSMVGVHAGIQNW